MTAVDDYSEKYSGAADSIVSPLELKIKQVSGLSAQQREIESLDDPKMAQDETLRMLQDQWASVLGLKRHEISIDDNFVSLGGESLVALKLSSILREKGYVLRPMDIIRFPTLAQQASRLSTMENTFDAPLHLEPFQLFTESDKARILEDMLIKDLSQGGSIQDCLPCSPMQEALVTASITSDETSSNYMSCTRLHLPHDVDLERLAASWEILVGYHQILRTIFVLTQIGLIQVVLENGHDRLARAVIVDHDRVGAHDTAPSFFLGQIPVHLSLIHSDRVHGQAEMVLWLHHAVTDGTSLQLLSSQLVAIYNVADAKVLQTPYSLFLQHLQTLDESVSTQFWQEQLHGVQQLPFFNTQRSVTSPSGGGRLQAIWKGELWKFAQTANATPAIVAQLVFHLALRSLAAQSDITFGVTSTGRQSQSGSHDLDNVIGPCVALVPFRLDLGEKLISTIRDGLSLLERKVYACIDHEHTGASVLRRMAGSQGLGQTVGALFTYQNIPRPARLESSDLHIDLLSAFSQMELDIPIAFNIEPVPQAHELICSVAYDGSTVSRQLVQSLLDLFLEGLSSITRLTTSDRLNSISMLSGKHETSLLQLSTVHHKTPCIGKSWTCKRFNTVLDAIEEQVRLTPLKIAIEEERGRCLTYSQLWEKVNLIAQALNQERVGKGSAIPVFAEKSAEMIVAKLAILKAGGFYVPLDPEHPAGRTLDVVNELVAKYILTHSAAANDLAKRLTALEVSQPTVINIDHIIAPDTPISVTPSDINAQDLAYVIFTSGTTGKPKGVAVEHGNIVASIAASRDAHSNFGMGMRTALFSGCTFDVITWDIYMTLLSGGTLCIAPKQRFLDDMSGLLDTFSATLLETTPTVMTFIDPARVPFLRTLLPGGETLTVKIRDTFSRAPFELCTVYGPSEIVVNALSRTVGPADDPRFLGKPIGHNRIYILDQNVDLCPFGAKGELAIAGPQVARGYLGLTELSNAKFLADPFYKDGSRMYLTGDVVSWTDCGSIIYHGRSDDQFKIRGFRIEPSEIEITISALFSARVKRASALQAKALSGNDILVAFVEEVPLCPLTVNVRGDSDTWSKCDLPSSQELLDQIKEQLTAKLPTHMVPSVILTITSTPLTPNGKADRRQLMALYEAHQRSEDDHRNAHQKPKQVGKLAPREETDDPLTLTMIDVWTKVLGETTNLSLDAHFYALGGDSLLAMHLSVAAKAASVILPVSLVLQYPTIRKQVEWIKANSQRVKEVQAEYYKPFSLLPDGVKEPLLATYGDIEDAYPCTPFQSALVSLTLQGGPGSLMYMSIANISLQDVDVNRLRRSWYKIVRLHSALRTAFVTTESGVYQVVYSADSPKAQSFQFSFGQTALIPGFESGNCPVALSLTQDEQGAWLAVFSIHHAISDGTSLNLLSSQLNKIYNDPDSGSKHALPPSRYSCFVQQVQQVDREKATSYWRKALEGCEPCPWPAMGDVKANTAAEPERKRTTVLKQKWNGNLKDWCRRASTTGALAIQTVLHLALSLHSRSESSVYGLVSRGRTSLGDTKLMEAMVGACVSVFPVHCNVEKDITIQGALISLESRIRNSVPHEHIGLATIKQLAGLKATQDFFTVLLTYQNLEQVTSSEGTGLSIDFMEGVKEMEIESGIALDIKEVHGGLILEADFPSGSYLQECANVLLQSISYGLTSLLLLEPSSRLQDVELWDSAEARSLSLERQIKSHCMSPREHQLLSLDSLGQGIEKIAANMPQKIAIETLTGDFVTYRQLVDRSKRIARSLLSKGIKPRSLVAVYVDRRAELIIAFLAILFAGSAYVPLDPDHPISRTEELLHDIGATLVLTTSHLQESRLDRIEMPKTDITLLDALEEMDASQRHDTCLTLQSSDLAYVLFTSGSTGKPKAVCVEHSNVLFSIAGSLQVHNTFGKGLRTAVFSGCTFDVITWDIYMTLLTGGTLCIAEQSAFLSSMSRTLDRFASTLLETTPTIMALIEDAASVPFLLTLLPGGEPLTAGVRDRFADDLQLVGVYGPTEIVVNALYQPFESSTDDVSLLGAPLGQNRVYILDVIGRSCPPGVPGELVISGPQVSRGYLNQHELTANKFLLDGTVNVSKPRMYKTGDLVCFTEGYANIRYLGRTDDQFKIRGMRIDPSEVEFNISRISQPHVERCTVVKVVNSLGRNALACFVSLTSAAPDDTHFVNWTDYPGAETLLPPSSDIVEAIISMQKKIEAELPSQMVPSLIYPVRKMPTSANNKIDRKALIQLHGEMRQAGLEALYTSKPDRIRKAPVNETEKQLLELWTLVLGPSSGGISTTDPFLAVGGDSMLAVLLSARACRAGLSLQVDTVLRCQTIQKQAEALNQVDRKSMEHSTSPLAATHGDEFNSEPFSLLEETEMEEVEQLKNSLDPIEDCMPCTPLQEAMVSSSLRHGEDGLYFSHGEFAIDSNIKVDRLATALSSLIEQHQVLRVVFVLTHQGLRQAVLRPDNPAISRLEIVTSLDASPAFELYQPPFKVLIRRGQPGKSHTMRLWIHHALSDGSSLALLSQRLSALYRQPDLTFYQLPFSKFIRSVRAVDAQISMAEWKRKLEGIQEPAWLKQDMATSSSSLPGSVMLKSRWCGALASWCRRSSVTMATAVQLALAISIGLLSNTDDVLFGLVSAGRMMPGSAESFATVVGPCVAVIPTRVQLQRTRLLSETMEQIWEYYNTSLRHQHVGVPAIQRSIGLDKRKMLFHVLLTYQNFEASQQAEFEQQDELHIDLFQGLEHMTLDVPIALNISPNKEGLDISANVNLKSALRSDGESLLATLLYTLTALISEDAYETDIGTVFGLASPLRPARQAALDTRPLPSFDSVHEAFRHQAAMTPKKIAVQVFEDEFVTYKELDAMSHSLCDGLRDVAEEGDYLIATFLGKELALLSSFLGILKAGYAYLPMDPDHPATRTQDLLKSVEARLIITTRGLKEEAVARCRGTKCNVLLYEDLLLRKLHRTAASKRITKPDLAYVLFTSGTTGKPKGVCVEHGNVLASIEGSKDVHANFGAGLRTALFSGCTFDVITWDIYMTLLTGGTLCVAPKASFLDNLSGMLRKFSATLLETTPTVMELISASQVPFLRTLLPGGEPLTVQVKTTFAGNPQMDLVVVYGPTEIVVNAIYKRFSMSDPVAVLGKPLGQNILTIIDKNGEEIDAPGVQGELVIGGPQVARGYLKNSELSRTKFQPDKDGGRRYHTGDLVCWNEQHEIVFVGRVDDQFKIKGFRIEPAEVEAAICELPGHYVRRAQCLKATNAAGNDALVAFIVLHSDKSKGFEEVNISLELDLETQKRASEVLRPTIMQICKELKERVPAHLVPSLIYPVSTLPSTHNNKVDHRWLRALHDAHLKLNLERIFMTAPGPAQKEDREQLCGAQETFRSLWSKVLGIEPNKIGSDDDFIDLGGDSILALRLAGEAQRSGFSLSLTQIFAYPTLRLQSQLCEQMSLVPRNSDQEAKATRRNDTLTFWSDETEQKLRAEVFENLPEIKPSDIESILPVAPLQEALMSLTLTRESEDSQLYVSSMTCPLGETVDLDRLEKSWTALVSTLSLLRTVFVVSPTHGFVQLVLDPSSALVASSSAKLALLHGDEHATPLCVSLGAPLCQASVSCSNFRSPTLSVQMHHSIFDGSSLELIWSEWSRLYDDLLSTSQLVPYKRFLEQLHRFDLPAGLTYWQSRLANSRPLLWPSQSAETINEVEDQASRCSLAVTWSGDHTSVARRYSTTTESLVRCALGIVLACYSNSTDVLVGSVSSGRGHVADFDMFKVAGPCAAVVPLRMTVIATMTFKQMAYEVHNQRMQDLEFEHVGLARIQRALNKVTDRLFDILLVYQGIEAEKNEGEATQSALDLPFSQTRIEMDTEVAFNVHVLPTPAHLVFKINFRSPSQTEDAKRLSNDIVKVMQIAAESEGDVQVSSILDAIGQGWMRSSEADLDVTKDPSSAQDPLLSASNIEVALDSNTQVSRSAPSSKSCRDSARASAAECSAYWTRLLEGYESVEWPQRCNVQQKGDVITATAKWSGDLLDLCQQLEITSAAIVQTALAWILSSYTGSSDVAFEVISNASSLSPDLAHVSRVPARFSLDLQTQVAQVLKDCQGCLRENARYGHGCSPSAHGVREVTTKHSDAKKSLIGLILDLQNLGPSRSRDGRLLDEIALWPVDSNPFYKMKMPTQVVIKVVGTGSELQFSLSAPDDIPRLEMLQFLEHLQTALTSLTRSCQNLPSPSLGSLSFISEAERSRLTTIGNVSESTRFLPVHEAIRDVARKAPKKIAMQFADQVYLTYAQLDSISDRLASAFARNYGVGMESIVPILASKGPWVVPHILGILKTGAAYVFLNPADPARRLYDLIGQCNSRVAVCDAKFTAHTEKTAVLLQRGQAIWDLSTFDVNDLSRAEHTPVSIRSDDVAYVLFTSGTTGTPKGVMVEHGNLSAYVSSDHGKLLNNAMTRRYCFAALTFDVSVGDIYSSLTTGGCLCLDDDDNSRSDVCASLQALMATTTDLTPTVAAFVAGTKMPHLQNMFIGGEPVPRGLIHALRNEMKLINSCGPTETVIHAMAHHLTSKDDILPYVPMGRPVGDMSVYIVNPDTMELLPTGCAGEMLVAGPQVTRGYLGDDSKTKAKYIVDPFNPGQGRRAFKSGDLGRRHADGCLEHLGRVDLQIKLNGLRIEPQEVEASVKGLEGVTGSMVDKFQMGYGPDRLVLHVTVSKTKEEHIHDLASSMWERMESTLAPHMIPTLIVIHVGLSPNLPLTPSGKVDRKLLNERLLNKVSDLKVFTRTNSSTTVHVEPRNPLETTIRDAWALVLGIDITQISIRDEFRVHGGDSIRSIQLLTKLRALGVSKLRISHIRPTSTIETQAKDHTELDSTGSDEILIRVTDRSTAATPKRKAVVFVHDDTGTIFPYQRMAAYVDNFDMWAIQDPHLGSSVNLIDESPSIEHLSARYIAEIYRLELEKIYGSENILIGGWSFGGIVAAAMLMSSRFAGLVAFDPICPRWRGESAHAKSEPDFVDAVKIPTSFDAGRSEWAGKLRARYSAPGPLQRPTLFVSSTSGGEIWRDWHVEAWRQFAGERIKIVHAESSHSRLLIGEESIEAMGGLVDAFVQDY